MNTLNEVKTEIVHESRNNGLPANNLLAIALAPLIIVVVYSGLLIIPVTRGSAVEALAENRPVELITFFFAIAGGVLGLILVWQLKRHREGNLAFWFYLVVAIGLLVIGAEEVAWGQWFWKFDTPTAIESINTQGELTLHNYEGFNDHLEIFPLTFGLAGLIGVWLHQIRSFRKISASYVLFSWFIIITLVSAIDLFQDFVVIQEQLDDLINYLDEVIEMLVAMAGFLYIWLNQKKFTFRWKMNKYAQSTVRDR